MKKILYICLLLGITSCVSKSKFEKLENDCQNLKFEKQDLEANLSNLQDNYDIIIEAQRREEIERNAKKYVSESEALGYLKDYYGFYNSDTKYRNIKLRRTDKNSSKVL